MPTPPSRQAREVDRGAIASLLRNSPVLLLAGPPADPMVNRLLHAWNPCAELGGSAGSAQLAGLAGPATPRSIAEGVSWSGPYRLDAVGAAEAGLPTGWSTAYAAQAERGRMRVPDGSGAEELRRRYPDGMPIGVEAVAWSLITGLARRLDGAARLPVGPRSRRDRIAFSRDRRSSRGARDFVALRPRRQQNTYCVYGNEALPWSLLCSILRLSLPGLDRNGALAVNDYCVDRPGHFEVRVEPVLEGAFLPYALRPYAAPDWPCTVYRFRGLPQATTADVERIDTHLRGAAYHLAEVVGGVLLDGEGFPVSVEPVGQQRR
jgi:hypothetical protein